MKWVTNQIALHSSQLPFWGIIELDQLIGVWHVLWWAQAYIVHISNRLRAPQTIFPVWVFLEMRILFCFTLTWLANSMCILTYFSRRFNVVGMDMGEILVPHPMVKQKRIKVVSLPLFYLYFKNTPKILTLLLSKMLRN